MTKLIKLELIKLKSISLFLSLLIIPLLSVIFGSINYYMNISILTNEWISLWTQVYMIYGLIFLPVLLGITVSFIWQSEHKKSAFKIILTSPAKENDIIFAKIMVSFLVILLTQLYFFSLYFISGTIFDFVSTFPFKLFVYLIITSIFLLPIISFIGYVGIKINSFVLPVGISLLLSISSLVLVSQNILKILQKIAASTKITIAMNHYPEMNISLSDWLLMTIFSVLIFYAFYILQVHSLKTKFK